jgi:hypothetical protein
MCLCSHCGIWIADSLSHSCSHSSNTTLVFLGALLTSIAFFAADCNSAMMLSVLLCSGHVLNPCRPISCLLACLLLTCVTDTPCRCIAWLPYPRQHLLSLIRPLRPFLLCVATSTSVSMTLWSFAAPHDATRLPVISLECWIRTLKTLLIVSSREIMTTCYLLLVVS